MPSFEVRVLVTLKKGVLDPEGQAVTDALRGLGFEGVDSVRSGKVFDVSLNAASAEAAHEVARSMASRLLANPVLEVFAVEGMSP